MMNEQAEALMPLSLVKSQLCISQQHTEDDPLLLQYRMQAIEHVMTMTGATFDDLTAPTAPQYNIRGALLMLITHYYENRSGNTANERPAAFAIESLLEPLVKYEDN